MQGAKVGQLLLGASAKKKHQLATFIAAAGFQAATPLGHATHGGAASAGANHHQVAARMVGHQKAAAKGADHLHAVAGFQITQIVGSHAFDGLTLVVLHHTLDGEREVVVTRTFAVAWTGDGILTGMVRLAVGVHARRDDAHRLPFQHRKRQAAKVEHDVVGFVVGAGLVDLHIAHHLGADG